MRFIRTVFVALVIAGMSASQSFAAEDGAIYGTVKAMGHKDVLAKWSAQTTEKSNDSLGYGDASNLPAGAIDYSNLSGIYAILDDPNYKGGRFHEVRIEPDGSWPSALAVAVGDKLHVNNETENDITVYLAGDGDDDIQELPVIEAGRSETLVVELSGQLELGVDEIESVSVPVVSGRGWRTQRLSSGDDYEFDDIKPGDYSLVFWFWRLGSITQKVTVGAGKRIKMDQILSVDRIVK